MHPLYWWLIAAFVLLITEIFTPAFFAGSIAAAALISALVSLVFPSQFMIQWLFFIAANIIIFSYLRKWFVLWLYTQKPAVSTNIESFNGKTAIVTKEIDNEHDTGYIKIYGDYWRAMSADEKIIPEGATVIVTGSEGNRLLVKEK